MENFPYFSTRSFLKSGGPTPTKIMFLKLARQGLYSHKVFIFILKIKFMTGI